MTAAHAGFPPLPADTALAARTSFGSDQPYLLIGDALETLSKGLEWPVAGLAGAWSPGVLMTDALATILQYGEDLTDMQTSEASRTRTDWKYALHLPLSYAGLPPGRLSAFRGALRGDPDTLQACDRLFSRLLERELCATRECLSGGFGDVIEWVECRNCVQDAAEAMSLAIQALACDAPEWLRDHGPAYLAERYGYEQEFMPVPPTRDERERWLETTCKDMGCLLEAVHTTLPEAEATLPEVTALRRVRERIQRRRGPRTAQERNEPW